MIARRQTTFDPQIVDVLDLHFHGQTILTVLLLLFHVKPEILPQYMCTFTKKFVYKLQKIVNVLDLPFQGETRNIVLPLYTINLAVESVLR